ncbi:hypothetical protein NLJ89_g9690 [Agrocybe chaxingu]|uniref:Uncharacterized protein n=1 Tax=Agrocybe chaxingu TaxID=84603 RepID=A0A9W8JS83_9AGAR|nr:hypothetical protein NLJ89_g9690 [Agrocybe chaxingu]
MKFQVVFISLLSFASVSLATTVAVVVSDMNNLKAGVTTLASHVKAFPDTGGKLADALAIHTQAAGLVSPIKQATADLKGVPTPISEADGKTLLVALGALASSVVDCSNALIAKHAAVAALPVGGIPALVKGDLGDLKGATTPFENEFLSVIPAIQKPDAVKTTTQVDNAFKAALAAYT